MSNKTVLVLGATGGIGGEMARQLGDTGWQVRALNRGTEQATEQRNGMTWLRGDALNRQDVVDAAKGCSVIVHAVTPARLPSMVGISTPHAGQHDRRSEA